MIQEFKIQNILSFKDEQTLSFEPSSEYNYRDEYCINVTENTKLLKAAFIYGANGSGKTNLLIALDFLRTLITDAPSDKNEPIKVIPFMLDEESPNRNSFMEITFFIEQTKYIYQIELNKDHIVSENLVYYPGVRPAKLYSRSYSHEADKSIIEFGNHTGLSKKDSIIIQGNTLNNSTVLATLTKVNVAKGILNSVLDYFRKTLRNKLNPTHNTNRFVLDQIESSSDTKEFMLKILKQTGFNISNIEVEKEDVLLTPELRKMLESSPLSNEDKEELLGEGKFESSDLVFIHKTCNGDYRLEEGLQSDGTIRFLSLIVFLYKLTKQDSIISIDEVESGLHYYLLRFFVQYFVEKGNMQSQLIFSTHDLNILNEDFIRRDIVWFAEKETDGHTELKRLSSKGLHKNTSIYNTYKDGNIGGVPVIDNIK